MKLAIAMAAVAVMTTGCIQSTQVKPVIEPELVATSQAEPTASDVARSCARFERFVMHHWEEETQSWIYTTFSCAPIFQSKQPPKPPNIKQRNYRGPKAIGISF